MHDSDGKPSAAWALATASTTSERSPGVITAMPSRQPLQHVLGGHARDQHAERLAVQQLLVAADAPCRAPRRVSSATDGATSSGSSGST